MLEFSINLTLLPICNFLSSFRKILSQIFRLELLIGYFIVKYLLYLSNFLVFNT